MSVDGLRIIETIINLFILYFILKKFLFKPVNKVLTDRENEVSDTITRTKKNEEKSKSLLLENEEMIGKSKENGKAIIEDYKVKAENISSNIVSEAHSEANLIMERAKKEAEREKNKAKDEIKTQIVDLAVLMSSKALEESIDEEKQRKLIDDFISKVGI
ncbi:F0F1 ATP synthase subunit B [Clostridium sp. JN-9]|uniref:F0F1 ATP synthase subunit B n=1 Tax=Clostridium sp. JN-9 TaxID=2507159 RepID=UPI000FFE15A5|nr:F0F1 ATP synthase subunit B [Clostridium sp. JN-9]QAT38984.1 F0F1 ATP synthase subunit B [Clostridium sp. JN-9]